MRQLSEMEKARLARILAYLFGDDAYLVRQKHRYTEETLQEVEKALDASMKCDSRTRTLFYFLLGSPAILARGWLRKLVQKGATEFNRQNPTLDGLACRLATAQRWRSSIRLTLR